MLISFKTDKITQKKLTKGEREIVTWKDTLNTNFSGKTELLFLSGGCKNASRKADRDIYFIYFYSFTF